ncbi:MAG TPA: hypothetical protein VIM73_12905, partial [Polyangiaceae bacterium]
MRTTLQSLVALPLFVFGMLLGCDEKGGSEMPAADPKGTSPQNVRAPRDAARIFITGHSLVDQPLPDFLARIGSSAGTPIEWNRQYVEGSAILRRARGKDPAAQDFPGYREGLDREGKKLDVVSELRNPQTVRGAYDVLLITEQHGMLETLLRNETVRYLRHYHDLFIAGNPQGTSYFYESWLDINDKSDPRRWIAYERAASPVWQCMATRVNVSLSAEGRADRIVSLPAGAALAELVARSTGGPKLDGITLQSDSETVSSLIEDRVHLTPLGAYYISLVTYSSIFQRPPLGAWAPDGVTPVQAKSLQETAWNFISD